MSISNLFYVYRITNTKLRKHYYGYRSTKNAPRDDLGKLYYSSSTNKEFILDQCNNPQHYRYKIIFVFCNKQKALNLEIKLHKKFKVDRNPNFYNLAIQTSTGFVSPKKSPTYMLRSIKTREVVQLSIFDKQEYVGHTKGKTKVVKDGVVTLVDVDELSDSLRGVNKDMVVALNTTTNKKELITKRLFDSSNTYVGHSKGSIATEQTREKLRISNKNNKGGSGNKGKRKSPEHIANIIAAKKRNRLLRLQNQEQNPE